MVRLSLINKVASSLLFAFGCLLYISMITLEVYAGDLLDNDRNYPNIVTPDKVLGMHGMDSGQLISPRGIVYAPDGKVYIAECGNNRIQVFASDGSPLGAWGEYGHQPGQFLCPSGIAVHPDGTVFVVDLGNDRIQVFSSDGTFQRMFGKFGNGSADLNRPRGIAVDKDRVYIANTGANRIQVYDVRGEFIIGFGGPGHEPIAFAKPHGIAVDGLGNIYVADMYNNRIQKFDRDGRLLKVWGTFGSYNGFLAGPSDVAFSPRGEIFIADSVNHRIQVFDVEGNYLYQFGRHPIEPHEGEGRLHYPIALATNPSGDFVAVCEKFEDRCQVFNTKKALVSYQQVNDPAWWEKYPYFHYRTKCVRKDSASYLLMNEEELHRIVVTQIISRGNQTRLNTVLTLGKHGSKPGELKQPLGIYMDDKHNVWVGDTLNHRIQVFNLKGKLLQVIGGPGTGPGQFNEPGSIIVDSKGQVYVADAGNNRIQVLNNKGQFLRMLVPSQSSDAQSAPSDTQIIHPINIELDPTETRLYVNDLTASVKVFDAINGNFITKFGSYGLEPGQFRSPLRSAVGPDGSVYVTDDSLNHISKFDANGNFILRWGKHGDGPGEFYMPTGVCADRQNRVWVVDYGNHRGQVFTPDGQFLFFFGEEIIGRERPSYQKQKR